MNIERKSATIENTGDDEAYPGTFSVVLSTGTKDRDGEEVRREEWQEPLPDHITFDIDHGMSVEKTVGSGRPYFDDNGRLLVDGTYSSLQKAQDVRTLVKEGHIRTVSVAFARHRSTEKGGKATVTRELLNGAFVAVPANTEAVVLAAKAGARNSASDQQRIQDAHDLMAQLGATCGPSDDTGAAEGAAGGKSTAGLSIAELVGNLNCGHPEAHVKEAAAGDLAAPEAASDVTRLVQAADAALDEAMNFWDGIDKAEMPEAVAQGMDLSTAAWSAVRALMDALHAYDPDGDDEDDASAKSAPETTDGGSSATDEKSAAVDALGLQYQAFRLLASSAGA